jgi:type VI secretion system lysozyme-like protein
MTYVLASFLDRLMPESDECASALPGRCSASAYTASVARDIEALLNARNTKMGEASLPGILGYGIPDFSAFTLASCVDQARIVEAIKTAIKDHEPRLLEPSVALGETHCTASLRFVIAGKLIVQPYTLAMRLSAELRSTTMHFSVCEEARRAA